MNAQISFEALISMAMALIFALMIIAAYYILQTNLATNMQSSNNSMLDAYSALNSGADTYSGSGIVIK